MIGLFTGIGYHLFHNELGVRLVSIIVGGLTFWVLYKIINPKNNLLFVVLLLSCTPLVAASFYAVPDIPLIFFSACFLWVYKLFLEEETYLNSFLLGVLIALLLYSKEHAVLLFGFVLLSNLKLLSSPKFYLAIAIGVVFFLPHLYWQYSHDFIAYRFHLFEERSRELYTIDFTLHYLYSQLAMAGIPAGFLLIHASYKNKNKSQFHKSLQYLLWGVYLFFFLSSFRGRTEANWTAINSLPLIILSYQTFAENSLLRKWLYYLAPISLLIFVIARVLLISDKAVDALHLHTDCHHYNAWADTIASRAGDRPVVFANSYQLASKYMFYTGKVAISLNNALGRKNQFSLLDLEDSIQGKQIYFYSLWGMVPGNAISFESFKTPIENYQGIVCDSFYSYSKVVITPEQTAYTSSVNELKKVNCEFHLTDTVNHLKERAIIRYLFYDDNKHLLSDSATNIKLIDALNQKKMAVNIQSPSKAGTYYLLICVSYNFYPPYLNSPRIKWVVKN